MWDFDVAKSECHIALPSIRSEDKKIHPPQTHTQTHTRKEISTKLEHKEATFTATTKPSKLDGIRPNSVYYVALLQQGPRPRWK